MSSSKNGSCAGELVGLSVAVETSSSALLKKSSADEAAIAGFENKFAAVVVLAELSIVTSDEPGASWPDKIHNIF